MSLSTLISGCVTVLGSMRTIKSIAFINGMVCGLTQKDTDLINYPYASLFKGSMIGIITVFWVELLDVFVPTDYRFLISIFGLISSIVTVKRAFIKN